MSGLINKVKEAVTGHHGNTTTGTHDTHGTHGTTGTHGTHGTTGTTGTSSTTGAGDHNYATHGPHSSTQGNYAVSGDPGYTPPVGAGAASGPHSSNLANKMDPRVDSDRDGHRGILPGSTGTTGTGVGTGSSSGPHSSGIANKVDPRVDSDRDGHRGILPGSTGTTGTGVGTGSSSGPHASGIANKVDPRVDSDRDGHRGILPGSGTGSGLTGTGATGTSGSGDGLILGTTPQGLVHGHHTTITGEKLDPHIAPTGIGRDGGAVIGSNTTGTGSGLTGTGTGSNTTSGPHNSNILNKLDPRVDSDRDGRIG